MFGRNGNDEWQKFPVEIGFEIEKMYSTGRFYSGENTVKVPVSAMETMDVMQPTSISVQLIYGTSYNISGCKCVCDSYFV